MDVTLLPLWFGIQGQIKDILAKDNSEYKQKPTGHAGMFYDFVWYLPVELKSKVMSLDHTGYKLETL